MGCRCPKNRSIFWSLRPNIRENIKRKAFHRSIHFTIIRLNRPLKSYYRPWIVDLKSKKESNSIQSEIYSIRWTVYKGLTVVTWKIVWNSCELSGLNKRAQFPGYFNEYGYSAVKRSTRALSQGHKPWVQGRKR